MGKAIKIPLSAIYSEKDNMGRKEWVNKKDDEFIIHYQVSGDDIFGDISHDTLCEIYSYEDIVEKIEKMSESKHRDLSIDRMLEYENLTEVNSSKEHADCLIKLAKKWYTSMGFPDLEFEVHFFKTLTDYEMNNTEKAIIIS